jgi:hypothetical protein
MGIAYCAGYADVIEWDAVEKIAPQAAADFLAVIDKHGQRDLLLEGLARTLQYDLCHDLSSTNKPIELTSELYLDTEEDELKAAQKILAAYAKLQQDFEADTTALPTNSKLTLYVGYHDSEGQGCRGDELDGVYWYVDGAYELSLAGQKYQGKFERRFFTSWG